MLTLSLHVHCQNRNGNGTGGLSARETVVWLCVESKSFNIDYFTISKTGVVDPSVPPTPDPYGGVAPPIPGYLQAEEFDFGEEGVGYSDTTDGNTKGVGGCGGGGRGKTHT